MDNSELAARMKDFYENPAKTQLLRRMPVAIRLDGKAFHTFTRGFQKPFDPVLMDTMQKTMKYLCENIQGCIFGYTQSDEITLILTDYQKLTSEAWFNYEVQKMASVSASMATVAFNKYFSENIIKYNSTHDPLIEGNKRLIERYVNAAEKETIKEPNVYFGEQIGERIIVPRKWKIDYKIPIFKGADRDYIDKLVFIKPIA